MKRITDSSGVRPGAAVETAITQKQTPLNRELRTNKKVTEFIASTMTLAAFQSGQLDRWLAAKMCGEHADTVSTGLQEDPALQENSVRPENAFQSHEHRYSLTSDHIDPLSLRKAKAFVEYSPREHFCQGTIARKAPSLAGGRFLLHS